LRAEAGGVALYIDAKSERTTAWQETFGAVRLVGVADTPPIPLAPALKTIDAAPRAGR
jgi:hypothetical protein